MIGVVKYRRVSGWPKYRVGTDGSVWRKGRRLKAQQDRNGYMLVTLSDGKRRRTRLLHRVVLEAWVGPCPPGCETRHLSGVRQDCRLSNLAWGSKAENAADRRLHGDDTVGERHGRAKLNDAAVRFMRAVRAEFGAEATAPMFAGEFGVAKETVQDVLKGRTWRHVA